jgi:hypothetical protein
LKGSDESELQSGLMSFWTLSITWCSKKHTMFQKLNLFSASGVGRERLLCLVYLKELTSITGQPKLEQLHVVAVVDLYKRNVDKKQKRNLN